MGFKWEQIDKAKALRQEAEARAKAQREEVEAERGGAWPEALARGVAPES